MRCVYAQGLKTKMQLICFYLGVRLSADLQYTPHGWTQASLHGLVPWLPTVSMLALSDETELGCSSSRIDGSIPHNETHTNL